APQDVDELGQLVELPATQHPAAARDPRIARGGDERARALAAPHRPELQDVEWRAPAPDPGLPEEDRPGPAQPDGQRRRGEEGAQEHQQDARPQDIETPLERVVHDARSRLACGHATATLRLRPSATAARTAVTT